MNFLYVHNLGPRSRNDIVLQYLHTFIYSIRCLLLLAFRSLTAIVSEKSTVFTFSYRKAQVTKFDLAVKQVKVTPGSSFEQTMMGWSPRCFIPSFVKINLPVVEKIFEGFLTIYGRGGHLGHVTHMPRTNFRSPYPRRLQIKFGFDLGKRFWRRCLKLFTTDGRRRRRMDAGP